MFAWYSKSVIWLVTGSKKETTFIFILLTFPLRKDKSHENTVCNNSGKKCLGGFIICEIGKRKFCYILTQLFLR